MTEYPAAVYAPRTKENIAGTVYDAGKANIGFAEDMNYLENEVLAMIADLVGAAGTAGGVKRTDYASLCARLLIEIDQNALQVINLKAEKNGAAANIINITAKSTGSAPAAASPIKVMIPDGNGATLRERAAAYLSGASSITLADAAGYWGKTSLNGSSYSAYLYAIWDGTGIIWAACSKPDLINVSATTTATDENYMLLETSSTYTRNTAHYCISIGKITFEYDTSDTPDYTLSAVISPIYGSDPNNFQNNSSESIEVVQVGKIGVTDGSTSVIPFSFIPSKIILQGTAAVTKVGGTDWALNHFTTIITITGTDTITKNCQYTRYASTGSAGGELAQNYAIIGYSGSNGNVLAAGEWSTTNKTLTMTYQETNTNPAATTLNYIATAYR